MYKQLQLQDQLLWEEEIDLSRNKTLLVRLYLGNERKGLIHIINRHATINATKPTSLFLTKSEEGIRTLNQDEIVDLLYDTIMDDKLTIVGRNLYSGMGQYFITSRETKTKLVVSQRGYVLTAYPIEGPTNITPEEWQALFRRNYTVTEDGIIIPNLL